MLKNYVTIALRTLWKQKGVTAINVLGLAAGMAVCLLVGLLVWDQLTHDAFHPGADRLYRVTTTMQNNATRFASSSAPLAPALRDQVTGVEAATRLRRAEGNVVVDGQGFPARALYAEPSFFDVFGFELVAGRRADVLAAPSTAVVSQSFAERALGRADPVGQTFRLADVGTITVTGVVAREAVRSHLSFDVLVSFGTLAQARELTWRDAFGTYTYLRLAPGTSPGDLAASFRQLEAQHLPEPTTDRTHPAQFHLQAVADLPLGPILSNEIADGLLPATVGYFLAALAGLVLLAAGFNYVNLTTARSLTRAREVGVRKAVGANRGHVLGQFVAEAVVVALLALGVAIVLLQGLVPAYNQLSIHQELAAQIEVTPGLGLYGAFVAFAVGVGLVAGLYPAWHLSSFQPARVMKSGVQPEAPGFSWMAPRKVLIVLQFAVALVVIVTTALLYRQAQHLGAAETGFRTADLVRVDLQDAAMGPFRQQARQVPGVERVAAANTLPLSGVTHESRLQRDGQAEPIDDVTYYAVDYAFVDMLDLPMLAADDGLQARFESGQAVLVSRTATRALGFEAPEQAVGAPLTLDRDTTRSVRIAGVVDDIYVRLSEAKTADPVVYHYNPSAFRVALAQTTPGRTAEVEDALTAVWRGLDATHLPEVRSYSEFVVQRYAAPMTEASGVLGLIAGLVVLISCLGLLGIATYTVQTRIREVGIRKALGATVPSIVSLLSKDLMWLIGAAVVAGLPLAWALNRMWLQSWAYRIDLGVGTFALSAVAMVALALLAIAPQALRAARANPATTLRSE